MYEMLGVPVVGHQDLLENSDTVTETSERGLVLAESRFVSAETCPSEGGLRDRSRIVSIFRHHNCGASMQRTWRLLVWGASRRA